MPTSPAFFSLHQKTLFAAYSVSLRQALTYFVLPKAGKFAGAGLCHQMLNGWMGCQTACRLSGDLGIRPIKFHLASYLMPGKGQGGYQGTFFRFHIQYAIHGYWKDLLIQLIPLA